MGNETPLPEPAIARNEETRLFGYTGSSWVSLTIDSNGRAEVIHFDSAGNQIDPATETTLSKIADALDSNAADRLLTNLEQIGGQAQSAVDVAAKIDAIEDALGSVATDHLLIQEESALDVSAATVDVQEDTPLDVSGAEVDVDLATQTLARLAAVNELTNGTSYAEVQRAGNAMLVNIDGQQGALDVSAATVDVQEATPLDVSAATVDVAAAAAGGLAVEQQTPVALEDTNETPVDPATPDEDSAFENGTAVGSGGSTSESLSAEGADTLRGRVTRDSTAYDVTVEWEDSAGNVLFTDTIASGVTAGTETTINEGAISPHCTVTVADNGSGSGAVTATP